MPTFTTKDRRLTPKTVVFDVCLNDKSIASCGNPGSAIAMAAVLEDRQVTTLEQFKALPWALRRAFVSATSMLSPSF